MSKSDWEMIVDEGLMFQRHNYQAIKVPMQRKAPADYSSSILNLDFQNLITGCC
jgi:hypothetical protein